MIARRTRYWMIVMTLAIVRRCVVLAALAAGTVAAQEIAAPSAELLPNRAYRIHVLRSVAGNDGFHELIPTSTVQDILVETGPAGDAGVPVRVRITHTVSTDAPAADPAAKPEWDFHFLLNRNAAVVDLQAETDEGEIPAPLRQSILARVLAPALLRSTVDFGKGAKIARPSFVSGPASGGSGEYRFTGGIPVESAVGEPTAVTKAAGTATYDAGERFYTEHRLETHTDIHIAPGIKTTESTTRMDEVTTYRTSIDRTE
jgi:hypothetical protein